jgi:hypothetical protein
VPGTGHYIPGSDDLEFLKEAATNGDFTA